MRRPELTCGAGLTVKWSRDAHTCGAGDFSPGQTNAHAGTKVPAPHRVADLGCHAAGTPMSAGSPQPVADLSGAGSPESRAQGVQSPAPRAQRLRLNAYFPMLLSTHRAPPFFKNGFVVGCERRAKRC